MTDGESTVPVSAKAARELANSISLHSDALPPGHPLILAIQALLLDIRARQGASVSPTMEPEPAVASNWSQTLSCGMGDHDHCPGDFCACACHGRAALEGLLDVTA